MNQISALLKNHKQNFLTNDSIELIAYAVYREEIALPFQKTIIESHFKQWDIQLKRVKYIVLESRELRSFKKDLVMILHQNVKVYLFIKNKACDIVLNISVSFSAAKFFKTSLK